MKDFEFEAASVENLEKKDSKELLDLLKSKHNKNDEFFYAVSDILASRNFICDEFPPIKKEMSEKNNKKIIRSYLSIRSNCDKDRDIIEYIAILQIIKERGMDPRFFIEEPLPSDDFIVNIFKNLTSSLSKFITKKKERINGDSSKLFAAKEDSNMFTTKPNISLGKWNVGKKLIFCSTCFVLFLFFLTWVYTGPSNQEKKIATETCTEFVAKQFRKSVNDIKVFDIWKKEGKIIVEIGYKEYTRNAYSYSYTGRLCVLDMKNGRVIIESVFNEARWRK